MSSVYVLEPPTRGKVVLHTTAGPLDIEFWPKEAPKAVRNFVQLCTDGYYDNTTFHRIIRSFMVQGGDRTGTGTGGESIYGAPFVDEFHSRLRFNHRGLVACAHAGTPNSNNSQFFMSLDRCDWLDKKNTIFGKVTGDTLYNLLKLGETETEEDDKPVDPAPMILSVEVLWSPFDDIVPSQPKQTVNTLTEETETKNKAKKVKQLNLLSFGEEAEQEEMELATVNIKIKSSHDVLEDPRLLKGESNGAELDLLEAKRRKDLQMSVRETLITKKKDVENDSNEEDDADFDAIMRRRVLDKRKQLSEGKAPVRHGRPGKTMDCDGELSPSREDDDKATKHDKLSLKKKGIGSEAKADLSLKGDVDAQLLSPLEQQRYMYKQRKRTRQGREETTLDKLNKFKETLLKAKEIGSDKSKGINTELDDDSGWLGHRLEFAPESGNKDEMARNNDPNQYVVHDPLLEKGKEKFNKMQAKIKRREREWAGKSVT